jgi:CheY-like chemotaxis protein
MDLEIGDAHLLEESRNWSEISTEDCFGLPVEASAPNPGLTSHGLRHQMRVHWAKAASDHDRAGFRKLSPPRERPDLGIQASYNQHVTILLVDDDAVDATAIRRSFQRLKIANPLVVARNGLEALDKLRGQSGHEKIQGPCLVLLDLNMPRMGGIEFLEELRADPALRRTVVFVMSTSNAPEDRQRAYDNNVAGYLLKYQPGQNFNDMIAMVADYWRTIEFPD